MINPQSQCEVVRDSAGLRIQPSIPDQFQDQGELAVVVASKA